MSILIALRVRFEIIIWQTLKINKSALYLAYAIYTAKEPIII